MFFFFFNDTATTEIYTLSLHDALPILRKYPSWGALADAPARQVREAWYPLGYNIRPVRLQPSPVLPSDGPGDRLQARSEEHTSELQSQSNLVCRLLLEKKKT